MQITTENASRQFQNKPQPVQDLINEAISALNILQVPLEGLSSRRLERVAMAFLAVANIQKSEQWPELEDASSNRSLRTRDIINYMNEHFSENISSGSYDDIRRKDLAPLIASNIVIGTIPDSARNNSQRGYAINPELGEILRTFKQDDWQLPEIFLESRTRLIDTLKARRNIEKSPLICRQGKIWNLLPENIIFYKKRSSRIFFQDMVTTPKFYMLAMLPIGFFSWRKKSLRN